MFHGWGLSDMFVVKPLIPNPCLAPPLPVPLTWLEVVKGVANQTCFLVLARAGFSVCFLCFGCMQCFVSLFLVVSASAIDCVDRLVFEWPVMCRVER